MGLFIAAVTTDIQGFLVATTLVIVTSFNQEIIRTVMGLLLQSGFFLELPLLHLLHLLS
jgi:hypothetical protein